MSWERIADDPLELDHLDVADVRAGTDVAHRLAAAIMARGPESRNGLLQLDSSIDELVPVAPGIRRCLDHGLAELVLHGRRVRARTVVVWQPDVLRATTEAPLVEASRVVLVYAEGAENTEPRWAEEVARACRRLFGRQPEWSRTAPCPTDGRAPAETGKAKPDDRTILMVSSNGTGMGHLTRLLAYARHMADDLNPYFLSMSQAVPVVAEFGFPYEYVASADATGMAAPSWRRYLAGRLAEAVERIQPAVVVFDGAWPYVGIADVQASSDQIRWVWSRRGMWYRGINRDQLAKAAWFDAVLEPGDFSAAADRGATSNDPSHRVGPVTLLNEEELVSRADARKELGLDAEAPTALVTLGAGNINDPTSDLRIVAGALRELEIDVCVPVPAIAQQTRSTDERVHLVSGYPLARYLRAFDVAVSAAGYNSFHELLRFGVPTLFLPNLNTSLDDQRTRARHAAEQGWAHSLDEAEPAAVLALLRDLMERGDKMVSSVAAIDPGNGARRAGRLIGDLVPGVRDAR